MTNVDFAAKNLAAALLAGDWSRRTLEKRAVAALGPRSKRRARQIVDNILTNHKAPYVPSRLELQSLLYASPAFAELGERARDRLSKLKPKLRPPRFAPLPSLQTTQIPPLATAADLARPAYDALKATLTNCARLGPASQNRDAHADFRTHLDGRIAWVERLNLRRGEKLRRIFETINW